MENVKEQTCKCQGTQMCHGSEEQSCDCQKSQECHCQEGQSCNCGESCECDKKHDKKEKKHKKHEKALLEKNQEIGLLQERLLRNQAEFQNFKRHKEEEIQRLLKYNNEDMVKDLLQVIDSFELAIKLDDNDLTDELSKFLEGFKLIYGNLNELLREYGVMEIEALGKPFDPFYHQGVLTDEDPKFGPEEVIEVLQKGYLYHEKVIRPAMVKVNK